LKTAGVAALVYGDAPLLALIRERWRRALNSL
jgi:hypothetical protein